MSAFRWFSESDPVTQLDRLQRDMDRLMSVFRPTASGTQNATYRAGVYPPLNVYDDGENLIVRAEAPGVDTKRLDITVTGDTLTIRGQRVLPRLAEGGSYHRRERSAGEFQRALTLPDQVDSSKVVASYKDGVLELRLPRAEHARPKKIVIQNTSTNI